MDWPRVQGIDKCVTLCHNNTQRKHVMEIGGLQWDDENTEHIAKHGISPLEVEDVCFGTHINYPGRCGRHILYGKTSHGRHLMVVIEHLHASMFRPITSRPMTDSEKTTYRKRIR